MASLKQTALAYAQHYGWHVHPVSKKKIPTSTHGLLDATTDPTQIGAFFANGAQIGVRTGPESGLFVLDLDVKKGVNGEAWLTVREQEHGPLPRTVTQRTGSGGRQLFFRWPVGVVLRNSQGKIAPGVDIRGDGGYAVVAPSHNEDGPYTWLVSPAECAIAEAPLWLIIEAYNATNRPQAAPAAPSVAPSAPSAPSAAQQAMQPPSAANGADPRQTYFDNALAEEVQRITSAPDGLRHEARRTAGLKIGSLIAAGMDETYATQALIAAAVANTGNARNAENTIRGCIAHGKANPRVISPLNSAGTTPSSAGSGANVPPQTPPGGPGATPSAAHNPSNPIPQGRLAQILQTLDSLAHTPRRLNLMTGLVEVNGEPVDDIKGAIILAKMDDLGFRVAAPIHNALIYDGARNGYHPVKDYFNGLVWDGGDHIAQLASYLSSDDPPVIYNDGSRADLHHMYLHRWLLGAVGKVFDQHQNMMLVLGGLQDIGKSSLVRWLCSNLPEMYIEAPINLEDKDTRRQLMEKFIWEVSELDATTRKADVAALKAFVTTGMVVMRKAFGRFDTRKPAVASLIGTFNPDNGFLADRSGNRRFFVTVLTKIDFAYSTKINVDQIWAEAVARYRRGESWQLLPEEKAAQTAQNQTHEVENLLTGYIQQYFTITRNPNDTMSAAEIVSHLHRFDVRVVAGGKAGAMEISDAMKPLNVPKKSNGAYRFYVGIRPKLTALP